MTDDETSLREPEWSPPPIETLAAMFSQYRIEKLIGRAANDATYRATQLVLNRPVAIRLLAAALASNEHFKDRFQREARTLAALQHPGIVAIYDFGQTSSGDLYFVTEFVDGTDLSQIIQEASLTLARALDLTVQVCEALHHAHGCGVIHRAVKPANVLVTRTGRAKLADFGLARPLDESKTGATGWLNEALPALDPIRPPDGDRREAAPFSVSAGTFDYAAPEQFGGRTDQRADIYALGVMLYEMLTGERPSGFFLLPSAKVQVDVRLDQVVIKALQQEGEWRYRSVSEMKTDLDRIRTESKLKSRTPKRDVSGETKKPSSSTSRRSIMLFPHVTVAVVSILAATGAFAWLFEDRRASSSATDSRAVAPDARASSSLQGIAKAKEGVLSKKILSSAPTRPTISPTIKPVPPITPLINVEGYYKNREYFTSRSDLEKYSQMLRGEPKSRTRSFASPLYRSNYPWKNNIVTVVFYVGCAEKGKPNRNTSAWDPKWRESFGGIDNPNSERRQGDRPADFLPRLNPFYCALPYNDVTRGATKPEARSCIPWYHEEFVKPGQSVCRDRWIRIRSRSGKDCYAQWSDCGPFRTDHWEYVFGDERPITNDEGAGLEVSPAVRYYLGLSSIDVTDWKFVEFKDVPYGPWSLYGTNNEFVKSRR